MSQITTYESVSVPNDEVVPAGSAQGVIDGAPSQADMQAFLEQLAAEQPPTEAELQKQYEKNFQTISYLFMKGVYSHAEEEIKRRQ